MNRQNFVKAFKGRIEDGEKFDNQWRFEFRGQCVGCGTGVGQRLEFPRWDPNHEECPKPEDKVVEYEMYRALHRNHACKKAGDLVGPDGRKLQGRA